MNDEPRPSATTAETAAVEHPGQALRGAVRSTPPTAASLRTRSQRRRIGTGMVAGAAVLAVVGSLIAGSRSPEDSTVLATSPPTSRSVMPGTFGRSLDIHAIGVAGWTLLAPTSWNVHEVTLAECDREGQAWWIGPEPDAPLLTKGCEPQAADGRSGALLTSYDKRPPEEPTGAQPATVGEVAPISGFTDGTFERLAVVGDDPTGDVSAVVSTSVGPPRASANAGTAGGPTPDEAIASARVRGANDARPGLPAGFSVTDVSVVDRDGASVTGYRMQDAAARSLNDRFVQVCVSTDRDAAIATCNGPGQPGFAGTPTKTVISPSNVGTLAVSCWRATGCLRQVPGGRAWIAVRVEAGNLIASELKTILDGN